MTSSPDIDSFLAALNGRRERLLRLVGPGQAAPEQLAEEMQELAEQLIVADEELRVQQEELEDTRRRLEVMIDAQRALLHSSAQAQVLTDLQGVVHDANAAADRLVRRPAGRTTPRPIATWFRVAHRAEVRSLIGRMAAGADGEEVGPLLVARPDGTDLPVTVKVWPAVGYGDQALLRWELREAAAPASPLRSVPAAGSGAVAGGRWPADDLADDLAAVALDLAAVEPLPDLLTAIAAATTRLVPGATSATVTLAPARGSDESLWGGDPLPRELQPVLGAEGPVHDVLAGVESVQVADVADDDADRWPRLAAVAPTAGVRSLLSVAMTVPGARRRGALTVYADRPGELGGRALAVARPMAAHAAVAIARVMSDEQLRQGMHRRQLIGQAVGILVERRRLTPDAAFKALADTSSRHNIKVRDLARVMVETGQEPDDVRAV